MSNENAAVVDETEAEAEVEVEVGEESSKSERIKKVYGERSLKNISPSKIKVDPTQNARLNAHTPDSVKKLIDGISVDGQATPVDVVPIQDDPDGYEYELVCGYGRMLAITEGVRTKRLSDAFKVQAWVYKHLTDEQKAKLNAEENAKRTAYTPADQMVAAIKFRDKFNYKQKDIAAVLGCSVSWISELFKLEKQGPDEWQFWHKYIGLHEQTKKLPKEQQKGISGRAAMDAASLPEDKKKEVKEKLEGGGKVTKGETVKKHKEVQRETGETAKRYSATISGMKSLMKVLDTPTFGTAVNELSAGLKLILSGEKTDEWFHKKFIKAWANKWTIPSKPESTKDNPERRVPVTSHKELGELYAKDIQKAEEVEAAKIAG